jgi:selenocysteine lyase/cysteine desulfurase
MFSDNDEYGHGTKGKFFLQPSFTNFNHGSFGTVAREVKAVQDKFFIEAEEYPDRWFRINMYKYIKAARQSVADMVNSALDDVVLTENASTAINSVLRSLPLQKGDKVLVLSTAYSMVTEVFEWLRDTKGIEIVTVEINFPVESKKQILEAVSCAIEEHGNVKLCVFSHITSMPSVLLPVEELVAMVKASDRNPNALVLIDGAHAPGLVPINILQIGADYYTGNLHKWCFCPKGCAFLWTRRELQKWTELVPTVIGSTKLHGYEDRFAYTGTRDYTAFATIPAALEFCASLGGHKAIAEYNHDLIIAGAGHCAKEWGTQLIAPKDMLTSIADVVLPTQNKDKIEKMCSKLQEFFNTFIICTSYKMHGLPEKIWVVRLSCQIYLEKSDFVLLAERVLNLLQ